MTTSDEGKFILPVNGRNIWTVFFEKEGYIEVRRDIATRAGGDSTAHKVFMKAWDQQTTTIVASEGGTLTDASQNVVVDFPPSALPNDLEISASFLPTRDSFPLPLNPNMSYLGGVQMGPEHIHFNKPVTIKIKNQFGLAPGKQIDYFFASHDPHDTPELYYDPGKGTVTADGQFIEFQVNHFSCIVMGAPGAEKVGATSITPNNNNPCPTPTQYL